MTKRFPNDKKKIQAVKKLDIIPAYIIWLWELYLNRLLDLLENANCYIWHQGVRSALYFCFIFLYINKISSYLLRHAKKVAFQPKMQFKYRAFSVSCPYLHVTSILRRQRLLWQHDNRYADVTRLEKSFSRHRVTGSILSICQGEKKVPCLNRLLEYVQTIYSVEKTICRWKAFIFHHVWKSSRCQYWILVSFTTFSIQGW